MRRAASYAVDRRALAATGGMLVHRRCPRRDASTARHAGLPRRARLPTRPRPRQGTTPRRQRPPRGRALLHPRRRQPAGGPDHQEQPRRDRDRRARPLHARRRVLHAHVQSERALGHGHRRLRRQLPRPRRVHQRIRSRRQPSTSPTTTIPGSAAGSAPPHASPAFAAPRPTPESTWSSRGTRCPWINFANVVGQDFFSARIGCQLFQPVEGVDLGALCIRPRSH